SPAARAPRSKRSAALASSPPSANRTAIAAIASTGTHGPIRGPIGGRAAAAARLPFTDPSEGCAIFRRRAPRRLAGAPRSRAPGRAARAAEPDLKGKSMSANAPTRRLRGAQRGFTLIEIMVVVVIIGLLAAIIGPELLSRVDDATLTRVRTDLSGIQAG